MWRAAGLLARGGAAVGAVVVSLRLCDEIVDFAALDERLGFPISTQKARSFWLATHAAAMPPPESSRELRRLALRDARAAGLALLAANRSQTAGFAVEDAESGVVGAGRGAFLRGSARRGDALTFYPGPVYSPVVGRVMLYFRSLGPKAHLGYIYSGREDGFLLDGSTTAHPKGAMAKGAYLNHPHAGAAPNCLFLNCDYDVTRLGVEEAADLAALNWYATAPLAFDPRRRHRCLIVVALRDLHEEELFVDYNYTKPFPAWFTPVAKGGEQE